MAPLDSGKQGNLLVASKLALAFDGNTDFWRICRVLVLAIPGGAAPALQNWTARLIMEGDASAAVLEQRKKDYKKTISIEEARRSRTETTIQVRKQKQEARLAKRRMVRKFGICMRLRSTKSSLVSMLCM